jgi:hypothetical protein
MPGWQPPPWTVRIRLRSESSNHRPRLRGRSFFSNFGQCLFAPGPGVNSVGDRSRCPGLGLPLPCAPCRAAPSFSSSHRLLMTLTDGRSIGLSPRACDRISVRLGDPWDHAPPEAAEIGKCREYP